MSRPKHSAAIIVIAIVLAAALGWTVAVARPMTADVIVPGGPVSGMAQLYRDFGTYQAQTVALAPFDDETGAAVMIDTVHHEVHEGEMFHAGYSVASVSNAASVDLLITTGAGDAHTVFDVFAGGQATVYLYEAPTVIGGTGLTEYNMKRASAITTTVAVAHTPTVTDTGTIALVAGRILPGGTSAQTRVGGGIRSGTEWILKPNTSYLLRSTNTSGSAIAINVTAEWYED